MCFLGHGLGASEVLRQVRHVDSSPLLIWEGSSRRPSGGGGGGSTRRLGASPPLARFSNARPLLDRGFLSDAPAEVDEESVSIAKAEGRRKTRPPLEPSPERLGGAAEAEPPRDPTPSPPRDPLLGTGRKGCGR